MNPNESKFYCDKCGICCKSLKNNDIYKQLDRGDGVCIFFKEDTKLCTIYQERPLICRIDEMYHRYFHEQMSIEEYFELNYKACLELKRTFRGMS